MNSLCETGDLRLAVPAGPYTIQADRDQFKQVLLNVMQNAIEATSLGGLITVSLAQLAHGVEQDWRLRSSIKEAGSVRRISRMYSNRSLPAGTRRHRIGIRNLPEHPRCTRRRYHPRKRVSEAVRPFEYGAPFANSHNGCRKRRAMRATIYVTDDEPAIRTAIVKRLSRRQHAVTGFESGEDLLRAVTQHVPDLILLDLKMPGMGGLEALRQIRPIAPQTLIIMLTAYGTVKMPWRRCGWAPMTFDQIGGSVRRRPRGRPRPGISRASPAS